MTKLLADGSKFRRLRIRAKAWFAQVRGQPDKQCRLSVIATATGAVLAVQAVCGGALAEPGRAWHKETLRLPAPAERIIPATVARGAALRAGGRRYEFTPCGGSICTRPAEAPEERAPLGGLPDGGIARHDGGGIARAWYGVPSRAYGHGVLGDAVEASALIAEHVAGAKHIYNTDYGYVFEDITPRLADLNSDGQAEIITILTDVSAGASLAVFGLRDGQLQKLAGTEPFGQPNRWLNVAGIADFDGDGQTEIAIVTTPHIGGTLEFWSFEGGQDGAPARLIRRAALPGFSNHVIGSRNLSLSAVFDANGDGLPDLTVPDASRTSLGIITLKDGTATEIAKIELPAALTHNIALIETAGGPVLVTAFSGSEAIALRPR
jgi:hypothetical protein